MDDVVPDEVWAAEQRRWANLKVGDQVLWRRGDGWLKATVSEAPRETSDGIEFSCRMFPEPSIGYMALEDFCD